MIPFSNRKYWPLFWTQFLGALNDNVLKNAMVLMITYQGLSIGGLDAPSIVALSGGIFILPFFLFSMAAGQIADKHEKSRLVRLVKIWEVLITLVAAAGFFLHLVPLLLIALFMMGTHSAFFGPIKYSALPELVDPDQLVTANAYVESGTFVAILLGTIGGAVTIAMPHGELVSSAVVIILAVLGLWTSLKIVKLPSAAVDLKIRYNPFTPVRDTMHLLGGIPSMVSSILVNSWFWFFGAAVLSILPPYCKDYLHVDQHVFSTIFVMYTLGIGLGSLICGRLSNHRAELGLVPVGAVGLAIFLFDISLVEPQAMSAGLMPLSEFLHCGYAWRLLIDFLMMSVAGGIFILPLYTVLQERSGREVRSRVIAGNNVINAIFMVVSAVAVMGLHVAGYSTPQTFRALVITHVVFCTYTFWRVPEFVARLGAIFAAS